jgi:hypothetical protein
LLLAVTYDVAGCGYPAAQRIGQAGDDVPEHDPTPAECIGRTNPA